MLHCAGKILYQISFKKIWHIKNSQCVCKKCITLQTQNKGCHNCTLLTFFLLVHLNSLPAPLLANDATYWDKTVTMRGKFFQQLSFVTGISPGWLMDYMPN